MGTGFYLRTAAAVMLIGAVGACATTETTAERPVDNTAGRSTISQDPASQGRVAGIGIEGSDIVTMADRMVRDMLTSPVLAGAQEPPQILIDASNFKNESSQRINKNAITDRLRVSLNRAANGRMSFVSRESMVAVHKERSLKRDGVVDSGTVRMAQATAGVDYFLIGRITTQDSRSNASGYQQRFNQIVFEMVNAERGLIVWSNDYTFSRVAADDVVYR
ncbi:MAG: penicillin-binding protein activator LpoB [Sphingomonadales bacterium]|nr:penicillin-binding protein activator LpoB [Sphingomonadales bacterium]